MEALKTFFQSIAYSIPNIVTDGIDILVVAFLIYKLIGVLRGSAAIRVALGVLLLLLTTWLTEELRLNSLNYILDRVLELGLVALVIVFQPELRRFLQHMGSRKLVDLLQGRSKRSITEAAVENVVNAAEILSREKVGALIVFERETRLDEYFKYGTTLDALVSVQLLRSLFFPKAALHDGAVIIRQGRAAVAACVLPLTENTHLSSDLGTRHRAGIGISEVSDALVVIVSEETGTISVAVGGMLKRHLSPQMLSRILNKELINDDSENNNELMLKIKNLLNLGRDRNEEP
ncbi:MAG: diadenylate cyclase CdaA [Oscillospiraceae bacterium]|nr:diadenylate cyclase CdaA [Oscillospiraceae bacterium]MBR2897353.1 diadenylate cyclase CdaA [Oscillospiraceae bacterium]MBR2977190.1 diadenylate cyclase CdaA [Oscillospiraceae bacterium]MBR3849481.1 diadenylate cyclase CdaA [Oscillospiraceae bacterium]